jgi:hypothetical protein
MNSSFGASSILYHCIADEDVTVWVRRRDNLNARIASAYFELRCIFGFKFNTYSCLNTHVSLNTTSLLDTASIVDQTTQKELWCHIS